MPKGELGQEQESPRIDIMIVCVVWCLGYNWNAVFVMMWALLTWLYSLLFATARELVTVVILTSPFKLLFFLCSSSTSYFFCLTWNKKHFKCHPELWRLSEPSTAIMRDYLWKDLFYLFSYKEHINFTCFHGKTCGIYPGWIMIGEALFTQFLRISWRMSWFCRK